MKKCKGNPHEEVERKSRVLAHQTTVKVAAKSKLAKPNASKIDIGQFNGRGSKRILRNFIVGKKRTRPQQANNNDTEYDDFAEIIESAKQKCVRRQHKLVPDETSNELTQNAANKKSVGRPRIQRAVPAEMVPAVVNANAAGPSEAISSILKECAKSNSVLHNIELGDCKIGKIEFPCKTGPSSSH